MKFISALLLSFSAFAFDIQIPNEIRDPGSVLLTGTPGVNQKDDYKLCLVARDGQGRLKADVELSCSHHKLGQDVHAQTGTYLVSYSGMTVLIEIKDVQVHLELVPLQLQKVDGSFNFSLYREVTGRAEQLLVATERFVKLTDSLGTATWVCEDKQYTLDASAKELCNALRKAKRPEDLLPFMKFAELGAVYSKQLESTGKAVDDKWVYTTRYTEEPTNMLLIGSGSDGDFLAVFPGVYSANFWSATRHATIQSNIVVK